ncbi:MAG: Acg family FMN-binding oxidoreductase [Streptosporangiaceae bacterium]
MTETTLTAQADYLIGVAARAPSLHNTQPWRFEVSEHAIELHADASRQLLVDPKGREMLISCGAALYGLRLAVRSLGRRPEVELLPEPVVPATRRLLARVRLGPAAPMTADERKMLIAVPHRHTHRGPFEPGPLPEGLLTRLQNDAKAEGATLTAVDSERARKLVAIVTASSRRQDLDPGSRAETRLWSRDASSQARDGVPAHAFPAGLSRKAGRLPQRDFDLGRGLGMLTAGGPAAPVTVALFTPGDGEKDWLNAGQALDRLLLRADTQWVFACLNTQPLEAVVTRTLVKNCLAQPGSPQMLLALGVSRTTHATARRPAADLTGP